jgi:hypothetical protein
VEARLKCSLGPSPQSWTEPRRTFVLNAAREQVLLEIVFRGRSRKARFLTANRKSP